MANVLNGYPTKSKTSRPNDVTTTEIPADDKVALDVNVADGSVEVTLSGLNIAGRITEVTLNDTTWTALPAAALANRNAMSIQNVSGDEIKINYSSGIVGYVGVTIASGNERFYDITENVIVYGKSESGTSPTIQVEELS